MPAEKNKPGPAIGYVRHDTNMLSAKDLSERPYLELCQFMARRRVELKVEGQPKPGINQAEFAAKLGMPHFAHLSKLEAGFDDPRRSKYLYPRDGFAGYLAALELTPDEVYWFMTWDSAIYHK